MVYRLVAFDGDDSSVQASEDELSFPEAVPDTEPVQGKSLGFVEGHGLLLCCT